MLNFHTTQGTKLIRFLLLLSFIAAVTIIACLRDVFIVIIAILCWGGVLKTIDFIAPLPQEYPDKEKVDPNSF